jgi:hypothetical protein
MTARERIANHLSKGKTITPAQAYAWFHTMSLSQHISALKKRGMKIGSYLVPGKRYAKYYAVGR